MKYRKGMTIMEIIVVLIIIAIAVVMIFPNFSTSIEKSRAGTVQSNLLAIYSAQQNYRNNNSNAYCLASCGSLAAIDTALSLNIQDDGTYFYDCSVLANVCTATRSNASSSPVLALTLNEPVNLSGSGTANPVCTGSLCP